MHAKFIPLLALAVILVGSPSATASPHFEGLLLAPASYVGLGVMDLSDEAAKQIGLVSPHGIEISSVVKGSPAERAGLRPGDIVLAYRGERVNGHEHFARLVRETPAGRQVELGVVRDGRRMEIEVEIGRREREVAVSVDRTLEAVKDGLNSIKLRLEAERLHDCDDCDPRIADTDFAIDLNFPQVRVAVRNQRLGAELERLEDQLASYFGVERGVLVRKIRSGSAAGAAGLLAGDVIVAVDSKPVHDPGDVGRALSRAGGDSAAFEIYRDREKKALEIAVRQRRDDRD